MTIGPMPICQFCVHFKPSDDNGLICDAFPEGIPEAIIMNEHDHRRSYEGDNGIRFEAIPKMKKEARKYIQNILGWED